MYFLFLTAQLVGYGTDTTYAGTASQSGHGRERPRQEAVPPVVGSSVGESQPPLPGKSSDATAVASGEKNMAKNIKEIKGQVG